MFPFSISGSFQLDSSTSVNPGAALDRLRAELELLRATDVELNANSVSFRSGALWRPFLLIGRRDPLSSIDSGTIWLEGGLPGRIAYRVSVAQMLIGLVFSSVVAFGLWKQFEMPPWVTYGQLWPVPLLWLALLVTNYLTAWVQVHRFLKHTLRPPAQEERDPAVVEDSVDQESTQREGSDFIWND